MSAHKNYLFNSKILPYFQISVHRFENILSLYFEIFKNLFYASLYFPGHINLYFPIFHVRQGYMYQNFTFFSTKSLKLVCFPNFEFENMAEFWSQITNCTKILWLIWYLYSHKALPYGSCFMWEYSHHISLQYFRAVYSYSTKYFIHLSTDFSYSCYLHDSVNIKPSSLSHHDHSQCQHWPSPGHDPGTQEEQNQTNCIPNGGHLGWKQNG